MTNHNPDEIRVFVALSLGDEMMAYLRAQSILMQEQFSHLNIRWVPFSNYHITLVFIGNVPVSNVDDIMEVVKKGIEGHIPFEVTIGDHALFPPENERKGVLIASVEKGAPLMALQDKLHKTFLSEGFSLIDRAYQPHVTLARLRRAKVEEEDLPKYGKTFNVPIKQVHLYRTWKEDGRVINDIVRSIDLI